MDLVHLSGGLLVKFFKINKSIKKLINYFKSLNKFLVKRYVNSMSYTLFQVFKINESIKTFMKKNK
jgi:hypothetical protein